MNLISPSNILVHDKINQSSYGIIGFPHFVICTIFYVLIFKQKSIHFLEITASDKIIKNGKRNHFMLHTIYWEVSYSPKSDINSTKLQIDSCSTIIQNFLHFHAATYQQSQTAEISTTA